MKRFIVLIFLGSLLLFTACFTNVHRVGNGPQDYDTETQRQWYVLWGLVPINEVDTAEMAQGSADYEIKTEFTFVDMVIGAFTGIITVQPLTVEVTR